MTTENEQRDLDSSLVKALNSGNHSSVEIILKNGGNPNVKGITGVGAYRPALDLAMSQPNNIRVQLISTLMAHGADPNDSEIFGIDSGRSSRVSPFLRACMRQDEMCAGAMLDSSGPIKVDLLARDNYGWIPSMAAIGSSPVFLSKLQLFFERETMPCRPDLGRDHLWSCVDNVGRNSAMLCYNMLSSLQWLSSQEYIDFPGLINTKETLSRETALWSASTKTNKAIVDYLLCHGAQANIVNFKGKSLVSHLESWCSSSFQTAPSLVPLNVSIKDAVKAAASAQQAMASIEEMLEKVIVRGPGMAL